MGSKTTSDIRVSASKKCCVPNFAIALAPSQKNPYHPLLAGSCAVRIMIIIQKRILFPILILIGTFGTANFLVAQPQPLPQISPQQIPLRQISPNLPQPDAGTPSLTLTRTSPEKLEQILRQVCGHLFVTEAPYRYAFSTNRNHIPRQCVLRIDPQSNRTVFTGDRQLCEQVFHLITAIDQPPPPGRGRQLIPYQHVQPEVLIRAFDSYRVPRPMTPKQQTAAPSNAFDVIQQVQFQEGGFFESGGVDPGMFMQSGDPDAIGVVDDFFRYRIVPELDVIIIEADGARLAQFIEMIRQLEELSKINKPQIEVVPLKHVNNVSLGYIFSQPNGQVYTELFQTVQGNVRIIPMTTPNAMLLIGWGDSMARAKEVIEALDLPIAAETSRLHIFKLTHIDAARARSIVQGAFPSPTNFSGFMARIQVFHDPRSNILIVQCAPNELEEIERIIKEIDVSTASVKLQVARVPLKHTLASDLASTLTSVIAGSTTDGKYPALEILIQSEEGQKIIASGIMSDVSINPDARHNAVIIRAPESCMAFIKELIALLDTSSPEAEIKIFQIEHADAASLRDMLTNLIPTNEAGTPGPQLPGAANEETLIPIRFAIDQRTNCIVAAGSPGDLIIVEALINTIDREDQMAREITVYTLKNMQAVNVAATVNNYIDTRLRVQAASPGVISDQKQLESAVIVIPDASSNSLIISASPKYYDEILNLIKEIDKSPPQVVIKVLVVEVTLSEDKEWAAELGLQDPLLFTRTSPPNYSPGSNPSLIGNGGPGILFNNAANPLGNIYPGNGGLPGAVGSQLLSNFGAGTIGAAGFGGMVFSASSDYISVMLRALHEKKRLEVLSSPQITTMNNQQATISVGQTVPRNKGGRMNEQGITDYIVEDTDVLLELGIMPNISPEGTIVMAIILRKEKLGPEVATGVTIDKARLETIISAANNQTVVLGGLITKDENKIRRKVPFLGDIPILGKMFRSEVDQTVRKELLVILTPRIVQHADEAEQIKQMEFARMSWCLNNVVEVYGDIGAYSVVADRPYTGNVPIITPGPVKMEDLQPMLAPAAPTLPTPLLPTRN